MNDARDISSTDSSSAIRRTKDGEFIESLARPELAVALQLEPHPEGGWYRSTWTSPVTVEFTGEDGVRKTRPTATLILFLLPVGEQSAWHRVTSSEIWISNGVGTVQLELGGTGETPVVDTSVTLGVDLTVGHQPQVTIAANVWQRTLPADTAALVSCLVSPGFDFADFSLEK